jgi:hypothetical protein
MKLLTREQWIGLAIALITIVLTLLALAVLEQREAASKPPDCVDAETRERVRTLSLRGYDEAYVKHTANLFVIWVQDPQDQPKRASAGTQTAISAYIRARALALSWEPPVCEVPLPSARPALGN